MTKPTTPQNRLLYAPIFSTSRTPLAAYSESPKAHDQVLEENGRAHLAMFFHETDLVPVVIKSSTLAVNNQFSPQITDLCHFVDDSEQNVVFFDRKSFTFDNIRTDFDLLDQETGEVFATVLVGETPLLVKKGPMGYQIPPSKLLGQGNKGGVSEYLIKVHDAKPTLSKEVAHNRCLEFVHLKAWHAYMAQYSFAEYEQELVALHKLVKPTLPVSFYVEKLRDQIDSVGYRMGWLLPNDFHPDLLCQPTFEQLKQKTFQQLSEVAGDATKTMEVAMQTLDIAARCCFISQTHMTMFLKFVATQSHLGLSQVEMRREVALKRQQLYLGHFGTPHSGYAITLLNDFAEVASPDAKSLWKFSGTHWEKLPTWFIEDEVSRFTQFVNTYCTNTVNALRVRMLSHELEAVYQALQKPLTALPQPVAKLNTAKGVVDHTGVTLSHDPQYGFNYCVATSDKTPTQFLKFLRSVWGHNSDYLFRVTSLQEAIGATLFGAGTLYQRAILLYGVPNSGKTQLLNIVKGLLPAHKVCTVDPQKWAFKYNREKFHHCLLNVCGELAEDTPMRSDLFKQVIDGSAIDPQPLATHWFASNHLPHSNDSSQGFARRWLVFHFDKAITKNLKVDLGKTIVAKERDQIINWAIEGYRNLHKTQSYSLPQGHSQYLLEIYTHHNAFSGYLFHSKEVKFHWDKSTCKRIKENPGNISKTPHLLLTDLINQARMWNAKSARPNKSTHLLTVEAAYKCLNELKGELNIILGDSDQGVVVFGVSLKQPDFRGKIN